MITTSSPLCIWNEAMTTLATLPYLRNEVNGPLLLFQKQPKEKERTHFYSLPSPHSRNEPNGLNSTHARNEPIRAQPHRPPPSRNEANTQSTGTRPMQRNEAMIYPFHPVSTGGSNRRYRGTKPMTATTTPHRNEPLLGTAESPQQERTQPLQHPHPICMERSHALSLPSGFNRRLLHGMNPRLLVVLHFSHR